MIYGIQILRGLAAIIVVFVHVQSHIERFRGESAFSWLSVGGAGVDIFFVISGFIIWVTSQSPTMTTGTFLNRRIIRIVPLYWLVTAFVSLVALLAPALLSSTVFSLPHVVASFAFVPYPHPVLHDAYPIIVPGWSLNYEAFFYLLFAIALMLADRLSTLYACLVVLVGLSLYGFILRPTNYLLYYYTDPIVLEFAFGLCIGALYTHGPKPPLWLVFVLIPLGLAGIICSGLAGWVNDHHIRFFAIGLPAAFLVFGVTVAKRYQIDPRPSLFVALGDASYSIYLTHVIVVPVGARLWTKFGIGHDVPRMVLFVIVQVGIAAAAGWLVHRLIERPMLDWLRRLTSDAGSPAKRVPV